MSTPLLISKSCLSNSLINTARTFIGFAPQEDMLPNFTQSNIFQAAFTMDNIGKEYIDLHNFVNNGQEIRSSAAYTDLKGNIRRFLEEMHGIAIADVS
jgi:hypothetical protein